MQYICKVVTLSVNGIHAESRKLMLSNFLYIHDVDIALLQATTPPSITEIPRYNAWVNIGTEKRGTATLAREGLPVCDEKRLSSGRGLAVKIKGIWYVNVYAPSGAERRVEREHFFNAELPFILPVAPTALLIAGDFICLLDARDSTGNAPRSNALVRLKRGLCLHDVWDVTSHQPGYTHYALHSATRLDRIYVTEQLYQQKQGAETVFAAFTEHMAVVLRLATNELFQERGRGYWRMNVSLLQENDFKTELARKWMDWARYKRYYSTSVMWWTRFVKTKIKWVFTLEGAKTKTGSIVYGKFLLRRHVRRYTRHRRHTNSTCCA
jgi:exonuclease III